VLVVLRVLLTRPWTLPRALHRRPALRRHLPFFLTPGLANALARLTPLGGVPRSSEFRLQARSPRALHAFLARLGHRYGFKRRQPPFRLDATLAAHRASRDRATEKLELYRLLKVARRHYGHLTQGQLWRSRRAATPRRRGAATFHSLLLFESRLDVLLLRARLAVSLTQARQLIRRGWVCVNGLVVFSYRFVVSLRDAVAIHPRYRTRFRCRLLTEWAQAVLTPGAVVERVFPPYLELDLRGPTLAYVPTLTNLLHSPATPRLPKGVLFRWGRFAY
jgi:ribosomal protein S4